MKKTVMISFRTSQDLKDCLDKIVSESNSSRSSVIEMIMREFLARNQEKWAQAPNGISRTELCIREEERNRSEKNVCLFLGGIRIDLPKNLKSKISLDEKKGIYQIELVVPKEENISSAEELGRGTKSEIEFRDQTVIREDASHV